MKYARYMLILLLATKVAWAQNYRIRLDTLTTLDDPEISVSIMSPHPSKTVRLPPSDVESRRFITAFYSWNMTKDPDIVIMVNSKPNGDLLYIDKNINNDLTDDGPPILFPFSQDTLTFEIVAPTDSKQRVRLLLARSLDYHKSWIDLPDSSKSNMMDKLGNLNPRFAKYVGGLKGDTNFKGSYGSFYFDDRVTLRRGSLFLDTKQYQIGVFDYNNNGLYDDSDDVLITDPLGNGNLKYFTENGVFRFKDVFSLGGRNFKIRGIDKYGTWIDIEETLDPTTTLFLQERDSLTTTSVNKMEFKSDVWNINAIALDNSSVCLDTYRGKYVLLNFWGEWCKPCLEELPSLIRASRTYSDSMVQFISFIKIGNKEKAQATIKDSGITWPQIPLTKELEENFRIVGYPTNILLLPNGKECLRTHQVNDIFFKKYLH